MANSTSSNKDLGRSSSYGYSSKPTDITPSDSAFEFQELDLYSSVAGELDETNKTFSSSSKLGVRRSDPSISSLPINIPDWPKILGKQYRQNHRGREEVADQVPDKVGDEMVPPHEFLAKTRMASMSVQEGIGRTLKGRDLRRVRNFVWAKTGFQD